MKHRRVIRWTTVAALLGGLWVVPSLSDYDSDQPARHWSSIFFQRAFTVQQAEALGYIQASPCEPGMGYHYLKPEEAEAWFEGRAGGLQVLLYDDTDFLVGIEYLFTTSSSGPSILGLDGPMEGHVPGMPMHYEQHIYFVAPQCLEEGPS